MDPVTQILTGAVVAQATTTGRLGRVAALVGAVGGELADVDVLFGPWVDPALPFELHRHFTHALVFIPVGGLLAAAPFLLLRPLRDRAAAVITAATVAFATHGLIDSCTSYGTHLLWPFTSQRVAWDAMSIIDPVFTLVLLVAMAAALGLRRAWPARAGVALALAYVTLGFVQHHRAAVVQEQIAARRGHEAARGRVMPVIGSVVLWRSVYEHDGRLHADAIRVPVGGARRVRVGDSVPRYTAADLPREGADPRRVRATFDALSEFAGGLTALAPGGSAGSIAVGDMRYSLDPAGFEPLWGLEIRPHDEATPVRALEPGRPREGALRDLVRELLQPGPEYEAWGN